MLVARSPLLCLLLLLLLAPTASPARPLTLEQALAEAEANDPSLVAARERVAAARARRVQAGTFPVNPEIDVEYSTAHVSGGDDQSASIVISQPIPIAGQTAAREREADRRIEQSELALASRRLAVRSEVTIAFYDVLLARSRLALRTESADLAAAIAAATDRLVRGQQAAPVDRMQADVERSRAEGSRLGAEGALASALATLRARLRLPPDEVIEPVGALPGPAPAPDATALTDAARRTRPDVLALHAASRASEAAADVLRREAWPDLVVGAGWQREIAGIGSLTDSDDFLVVRLAWDIPAFNRSRGAIAEAERLAAARRADADARAARVEREVRSAAARLDGESRRLAVLTASVPVAEEAAALIRKAFEAGQLRLTDALAARERALRLREDILDAHDAVARARADLLRATGLERLP